MNRWTTTLLTTALCAALLCVGASAAGTADNDTTNVIQIGSAEDLAKIGQDGNYPLSGSYLLTADIDLGGSGGSQWTPIGTFSTSFTGTFNGGGYTISGLHIDNTNSDYQGLFGYVGIGGTVQNLTVSGTVSGDHYVGGVVGYNAGTVENCANTSDVTGTGSGNYIYVGGVVGDNNGGTVTNCYNTGSVSGNNQVGGVAGYNTSTVTNCYYLDTTASTGIGSNSGTATNVTSKTSPQFSSGEVAWRLQNGQAEGSGQVWGQTIGTDTAPVFTTDGSKQVIQLTMQYNPIEGGNPVPIGDGYDYYNTDDFLNGSWSLRYELPDTFEGIPQGMTVDYWTLASSSPVSSEPGMVFQINSDAILTATLTKATIPATGVTLSPATLFLRPEDAAALTATVTPNDTTDSLTWTSSDPTVATVDQNGAVTAVAPGQATITAQAGTASATCTVTVTRPYTPPVNPNPQPEGPSTGGAEGWDGIQEEIASAQPGQEIVIDMGETTEVPAEIFQEAAGKDVTIVFDLGSGLSWTLSGQNLQPGTEFTDLNLGVDLGTDSIPGNVFNAITGEISTVQLTLAHDGPFGFTMTLTAPLGEANAHYWANLYHYDEAAGSLAFETAAVIGEDGTVSLSFSHASQFAIVIDDHSHAMAFTDVGESDWFYDAVAYAYRAGLMDGVGEGLFSPGTPTTRAQLVTILYRLEGQPEVTGDLPFSDVEDGTWYTDAVIWAAANDIVNGIGDNQFGPENTLTREQLVTMLYRYAQNKGYDVTASADLSGYPDAGQIQDYAQPAMAWAVAENIIQGMEDGTLKPAGNASRAQIATILMRFCEDVAQ